MLLPWLPKMINRILPIKLRILSGPRHINNGCLGLIRAIATTNYIMKIGFYVLN